MQQRCLLPKPFNPNASRDIQSHVSRRLHACKARATNASTHKTTISYKLRRASLKDSQAVAGLYSEVFGAGNFPGYEDNPLLQQVESQYASAIGRESSDKLAEALANKAEAALQHRMYRITRQAAMLKGQLRMAQGLPASFPIEGPTELRQVAKWWRARSFVCLLAEQVTRDGSPGQVVGTATLSLMQAEAALPPPFPSSAPMRAYISNMAVAPGFRRQGLAKTLVGACGRLARAWGQPAVLLHVAADNTTAQQLYQSCGFAPVPNSQGFSGLIKGPWTQQRMVADPAVLAANFQRNSISGSNNACTGSTDANSNGQLIVNEALSASEQQQLQGLSSLTQQAGSHPSKTAQHVECTANDVEYLEDEEDYSSGCELLWNSRGAAEVSSHGNRT